MLKKLLLLATAALFLLSVTLFNPATISRWIERAIGWEPLSESPTTTENFSLREAVAQIAPAGLERHLRALTADASRVTGYPGAENAARYLEQEFRRLGLEVESESFPLSVPIDRGGRLRLADSEIKHVIQSLTMVSVEEIAVLTGGILKVLKDNIKDRKTLEAIGHGISRLLPASENGNVLEAQVV